MLMDHNEHSSSSQSTYAYYFTELTPAPALSFQPPDWLRVSADHFAEVAFVFGGYEAAQNDELKEGMDNFTIFKNWRKTIPLNCFRNFLK